MIDVLRPLNMRLRLERSKGLTLLCAPLPSCLVIAFDLASHSLSPSPIAVLPNAAFAFKYPARLRVMHNAPCKTLFSQSTAGICQTRNLSPSPHAPSTS